MTPDEVQEVIAQAIHDALCDHKHSYRGCDSLDAGGITTAVIKALVALGEQQWGVRWQNGDVQPRASELGVIGVNGMFGAVLVSRRSLTLTSPWEGKS